jgi:hypothetical protein
MKKAGEKLKIKTKYYMLSRMEVIPVLAENLLVVDVSQNIGKPT